MLTGTGLLLVSELEAMMKVNGASFEVVHLGSSYFVDFEQSKIVVHDADNGESITVPNEEKNYKACGTHAMRIVRRAFPELFKK
jgi:hypothetical protein